MSDSSPEVRGESPLIECFHVAMRYGEGRDVLKDVDFAVHRGEFICIAAPSGAGKSTLLRMLLGLEAPSEGQIRIEGRDLQQMGRGEVGLLRRRISLVPQDERLLMQRSVFENVALPLEIAGSGQVFEKTRRALRYVGLAPVADLACRRLSASERRRVALARAIVGNPVALLADDPTGSMDDEEARTLWELLRDIHMRGTTVVAASRSLPEIECSAATVRDGAVVGMARKP